MPPDKNPFRFRDFIDLMVVNAKVIFALLLFLVVFLSIFFGYYSFLLIAFILIFMIFIAIDAVRKHKQNGEDSE